MFLHFASTNKKIRSLLMIFSIILVRNGYQIGMAHIWEHMIERKVILYQNACYLIYRHLLIGMERFLCEGKYITNR